MLNKILKTLAVTKVCQKIGLNLLLKDIPDDFFRNYYNADRPGLNGAILLISGIFSLLIGGVIFSFFDLLLGFLVFGMLLLSTILFFTRRVRKDYFGQILKVEQYSDLICREIVLILSVTNSLPMVVEFLSKGNYPIISPMLNEMIKKLNLGYSPNKLLRTFAEQQPSETIKEFIIGKVVPIAKGEINFEDNFDYDAQWKIRSDFDAYLSQIEGKMSIFLSLTTIIPVTVSMLLVMFGYININLVIFLPFIFFVFGLIALEVLNTGRVKLLGGKE